MEQVMPDFITYLTNERNASKSTVSSYCRDLERMFQFLDGKGIKKTDDVTPISLNSYILYLEKEGFSISTVSRNVASMKAYFHYAFGQADRERSDQNNQGTAYREAGAGRADAGAGDTAFGAAVTKHSQRHP